MYIEVNGVKYPGVRRRKTAQAVEFVADGLGTVETVAGEVIRCRDDGFVLGVDRVAEYARVEKIPGGIRLTNLPEVVPSAPAERSAIAAQKIAVVNAACERVICDGVDVTLGEAVEHFSLELADQTNIESMFSAVTLGAQEQMYHCDGGAVKAYSAADVVALYAAYRRHVAQCTTRCNLLKQWIRRENDSAVLVQIGYDSVLPEDLAAQMQDALGAAEVQLKTVVAAVGDGAFVEKLGALETQVTQTQMALCDVYEQVIAVATAGAETSA